MKKIYVLSLLAFFLLLGKTYAQVPNNQDCLGAIPVCQSTYNNPNSYVGTGNIGNEINAFGGTCLYSGEKNDVWYQFTVQSSGQLCFIINPVSNSDDYDWAVYNLTSANCSNIYSNLSLETACDYSGNVTNYGVTGASVPWVTGPNQNGNTGCLPSGTYNASNDQINNCPTVTAGQSFVLNVSNFSSTASGYSLYFPPPGTAGMAAIYDNVPPAINSLVATPSCGATTFAFNFSENVLCSTVSTGDFTLSGPGGPYTVTGISGPACVAGASSENTFTVTTSPAITTSGTYSLCLGTAAGSVTDLCGNVAPAGCFTFNITGPTVAVTPTNPNCSVGTGTITANGSGGTGSGYQYSINGGTTFQASGTFTGLAAGTYTVIVRDGGGCRGQAITTITIPTPVTVTLTPVATTCAGNNGSITATPGGGTPGYTYAWAPSGSGSNPTGLTAGNYTVTVTDSKGCVGTGTTTIATSGSVTSSFTSSPNQCLNTNSFTFTNTGTVAATHGWTFPSGTPSSSAATSPSGVTWATAGTYTVTHTVTSGACVSTTTIAITIYPRPNGPALAAVNPTCGNANGTINVSAATGGTPAYQYNLNGGASTGLTNYPSHGPGTYTVNVIDQNGCTNSSTITLTNVPGPTAIALTPNTAHCSQSDGSIAIGAVTGGTSGYTFSFNNPAGPFTATSPVTALAPGTYSVTVKDANGCIFTTTATVPNAAGPSGPNASSTAATCGGSNGTVTLAPPTTGTGPYTYSFNGGGFSSTTNYTGLAANAYTYTVKDNFGCPLNGTVTVNSSSGPTGLALSQTPSACGASNGQITIGAVTGGLAPYTYSFNGGPFTATSPITGLAPATYSVTVKDANGCTFTNTIAVATTAGPSSQVVATTNSTCGNANGVINLGATTGGTSPYTYAIDAGGFAATTTYTVTAGTHTVSVKDNNGCTYTVTTTVSNTPGPTAVALTQTPSNCGLANGVINVGTVTGGTAAYQYSTNGVTFQASTSFSGLLSGNYTITVKDANGCLTTGTVSVTTVAAPTASVSTQTNITCNGLTNGSASIAASGGAGSYTYTLTPGGASNGTGNFTNLAANSYTVTVTDGAGCTTTTTFTITQPAVLTGSISAQTNVSCNTGTNGAVTVTQTGGTAAYTYSLNGAAYVASPTFSGLAAGSYVVTVKDSKGCLSNVPVTITQPTAISLTMSSVNANCTASNGSATVVASGGTPGYTYSWAATGGTAATTIPRPAGSYTVTVTDANSCVKTGTVTIGTTPGGTASVSSAVNATCNGANNGSITVSMGGGSTAPFTYAWTPNVGTGATVSNLAPGNYSVIITDANGCTATTNTTITEPALLNVSFTSTNVSCNGGNDGTINATVTGGTSPYTYAWSPGAFTTANITGIPTGTYNLTVTDSKGCVKTGTRSVTQPTALTITPATTNPHCGLADGSATVTGSGGAGGYTFSLNGGAFGAGTFSGLSANTYTVTIKDANNCTLNLPLTLVDQAGPTATITTSTNVSCNGGNNGSATVSVTGGITPYTYLWTPSGQTTQTANNLTANVYGVVITDASGCHASASITITEPPVLQINASGTDPVCNGQSTGSGTASAFGGTAPYTFSWATAPPQSGANASNLGAGTYNVTVTDSKGCTRTTSILLNNPALLTASITTTNLSCFNVCNGTATATTTNGTSPFAYSWNDPNSQTGATASGLCAGSYTVNITDSRGCTTSANTTITQPTLLTSTIINPVNVTCSGQCNGSGAVNASGGTAPYSYSWSNGATTSTNTGLCVGSYTSTVTDANLCVTTATLTISTPSPLTISATSTNASCNNVCDGTATSTFSGGTAPYSFIWQPSLSTTFNAASLCDGTHTVTITDANGCSQTATTTVTEPSALVVSTDSTNTNCGQALGSAQVFVSGGTPNYTYSWSNGGTSAFISGLTGGPYSIIVTDANGCTANDVAIVNNISGPSLTLVTSTNISCFGANDGSATVTVSGGTPPLAVQSWLLPSTLAPNPVQPGNGTSGTILWPGINVFHVVDAAGCVADMQVPIQEPTQLVSAINNTTNVSCFGFSNGSTTMLVNGGTPSYTYSWAPSGGTNGTASGLTAGTYTCSVTDANGCATTQSVTITEPVQLAIINNLTTSVDCYGASNGSINVTPSGGTPAYTYLWSGPNSFTSANTVVNGLAPGAYNLQVTDSKNCSAMSFFNITEPPQLTATINPLSSTCSNPNGSMTVVPNGGTLPYTYNWNTVPSQTAATATNLNAPATYACIITDGNGCILSASSPINDLPPPTIDSITVVDLICNGVPQGSATVWPKPGGSPISTYVWTLGSTPVGSTATASGLAAGVYTITVMDGNGCTATGVTSLTEPFPLTVSVSPGQIACDGQILGVYAAAAGGTPGPTGYSYTWSGAGTGLVGGGNHNITFTNSSPSTQLVQTFSVTVDDANGCGPVTPSFTVTILPRLTAIASDLQDCDGNIVTINASASGGSGGSYSFSWTAPPSTTITPTGTQTNTLTATASATVAPTSQTYTLTVSDGCSTPDTNHVVLSPLSVPNASFTSDVNKGCAGFPVTFVGSAGSGFSGCTFSWIFEDGTITTPSTVDTVVHTFSSALPQADTVNVQLVVTTAQGCRDTSTIINYITVYPDPIAQFTYGPETITEFDPLVNFYDASISAATYSWFFDDSLATTSNYSTLANPSHVYQEPGYYDVQLAVASIHGCKDTIVHQIYVEPEYAIYVPNAFSPNDDARNEVFMPMGIGIDEDRYHLYIFDRWGEMIFESNKLSTGWDGRAKGSSTYVQQDVYIYKIIAYDIKNSKHSITGHVTVVR
jgi:gliding motility-associated-like protein